MEQLAEATRLFTLLSPVCFLILVVPRAWWRLAVFLPLSLFPPALLLFGLSTRASTYFYYGVVVFWGESVITSVVLTVLGCFLILKARPDKKASVLSKVGTAVASIPAFLALLLLLVYLVVSLFSQPPEG